MWHIPSGPWNTNYDLYDLSAANLTDLTAASGYILTATFNDLSANTSPTYPGAPYSYGEYAIVGVNNLRYDLSLLSDGNGGQFDVINPFDANSPTSDIPGLGTNPVTLTVVFDNSTQLANSYINGVQVITGYAGNSTTFTCNCLAFGGELGDFSNVELVSGLPNPNAILPLTVTNSGSAPLTFSVPATITGTNAGDFTFAPASTCTFGTALAVGKSCVVNILFLPTGTGVRTATLTFTDNSGTQQVLLSGTGATSNPVPTLSSIAPTTGTLGQPVTLTLTGTNFLAGAIVNFGTNADTGGMVSNGGTTLTITIPATQLSAAGPVSVTVTNPAPTAGPSAAQTFTVNSTTGNLVITISGTVNVPRSPAAFSFPVESVGGLGGVLNSKCASPTISCLISPCPTTLLANSTVMMTVTLYTSPQMTGVIPNLREWPRQPGWRIALWCLAGLLLVCFLSARKPKVRWGFAVAALAFGLVGGCGGGSVHHRTQCRRVSTR